MRIMSIMKNMMKYMTTNMKIMKIMIILTTPTTRSLILKVCEIHVTIFMFGLISTKSNDFLLPILATFKTSFTAPQFGGQKRPKPAATTRTRTWTTKLRTRNRATKKQGGPLLKLLQRLFS